MAKIFNLANEVLASIFKHLDGLDLGTVAKTCQRFRNASFIDQIWHHLCERGKLKYLFIKRQRTKDSIVVEGCQLHRQARAKETLAR